MIIILIFRSAAGHSARSLFVRTCHTFKLWEVKLVCTITALHAIWKQFSATLIEVGSLHDFKLNYLVMLY